MLDDGAGPVSLILDIVMEPREAQGLSPGPARPGTPTSLLDLGPGSSARTTGRSQGRSREPRKLSGASRRSIPSGETEKGKDAGRASLNNRPAERWLFEKLIVIVAQFRRPVVARLRHWIVHRDVIAPALGSFFAGDEIFAAHRALRLLFQGCRPMTEIVAVPRRLRLERRQAEFVPELAR